MSIESWIKKEVEREARIPRLESALLTREFKPYLSYRLRFFFLRLAAAALIHAIEFPFIYHVVRPGAISPILFFSAIMHIIGQWWWGSLELMRTDVLALVENQKAHRVAKLITPWLRTSFILAAGLLVIGGGATVLISNYARFPYLSTEHVVLLVYLIRGVFFIPITTYHSGIYAVQRVGRPIAVVFLVDFLGLAIAFALKPFIGGWALPLSLICSALVQNSLAILYVGRMYRFIGWDVPFFSGAGKLLSARTFLQWKFVLAGAAAIVMCLDSLMIIALSLPQRGARDASLAMLLFLAAPLVRACHDWAMLFFPDIRRLNLELFQHLYRLFTRVIQKTSIVVARITWLLAVGAAAAALGDRAVYLAIVLGPLFLVRSMLAFAQVRAFTAHYFAEMLLGGICFVGGSFAVPFVATTDPGRILCFTGLYLPILIVTGLRYFHLLRGSDPEALDLPSVWFKKFKEHPGPLDGCAILLPFDSNSGERRQLMRHLARTTRPVGSVTTLGERIVLAFDHKDRLRSKVSETLIHAAGLFDQVRWFQSWAECGMFVEDLLAAEQFSPDEATPAIDRTTDLHAAFFRHFPNGALIDLQAAQSPGSIDGSMEESVLGGAVYFAKNWEFSPDQRSQYVSTVMDGDAIKTIFLIAAKDEATRRVSRKWQNYIAGFNLRRALQSGAKIGALLALCAAAQLFPAVCWAAPNDSAHDGSLSEIRSLQNAFRDAESRFGKVYGSEAHVKDIPIVAGSAFFFLRPWFRFRANPALGPFSFNPVAIAEFEALDRTNGQCSFKAADGKFYTTWDTVVRAEDYITAILTEFRKSGRLPWSTFYLEQPQIKKWFEGDAPERWYDKRYGVPYRKRILALVKNYYSGASKQLPYSETFDLDILFSIHSAVMDGSHPPFHGAPCGGYGEFRVCEGPPVPEGAERERLARRDLPLLREIAEYLDAWRKRVPPPSSTLTLAAKVRQELNNIHPFRDGNGRTAKLLTQLILQTEGLPQSSVSNGYLENSQTLPEYTEEVRLGVRRTIQIISSCADFLECAVQRKLIKPKDWEGMCGLPSESSAPCAAKLLSLELGNSPADMYTLAPCDCSLRWKSQSVQLPQCGVPRRSGKKSAAER